MNDFLYLPTLVSDHRSARMASADRHRLLAGLRKGHGPFRRPALTLAASTVRTTEDATTRRAA